MPPRGAEIILDPARPECAGRTDPTREPGETALSSPPLLSISHLRVQYGRFLAVDDVSFDLYPSHLLGMIGPNGAGKTTTLRAAAGLQAISTGSVQVMGQDVFTHYTEVGHHLGFTPDTPAVYDNLTVDEFLRFIGKCYGLPPRLTNERIDHWLTHLWLAEKRTSRISALSRGMRQRLAVARTLLPDPHVVLLDEPAAGLDPAGRVQFRRLLASLRNQGKAIIVSSHILSDLAEYCTHIAIMERGRFLQYGSVEEVTGHQTAQTCNYRIVLAQRIGDLPQRLATIREISPIEVDGEVLTLQAANSREAAARLLSDLVSAGLPVAEFRPLREDLEQVYLRSGIGQVD